MLSLSNAAELFSFFRIARGLQMQLPAAFCVSMASFTSFVYSDAGHWYTVQMTVSTMIAWQIHYHPNNQVHSFYFSSSPQCWINHWESLSGSDIMHHLDLDFMAVRKIII
jgi:hypothetical protein